MPDLRYTYVDLSETCKLADEKAKALRLRRKLLELEQRRRAGDLVNRKLTEDAIFSSPGSSETVFCILGQHAQRRTLLLLSTSAMIANYETCSRIARENG